jgi:dolichol-phosphate mannosyltransferase
MTTQAQGTSHPRVSVVIPTRNEALTLKPVLEKCRPHADEILVIDGHSTDGTRELAASLGAKVVLDNGRGKGAALRQAIALVRGDIVVFIDADGSHDPEDIPKVVGPIARGEADHCVASRMRGGSDELFSNFSQFVRMLGGQMITLAINYRFGVRITDSQNGFRAFRTEAARILPLSENGTTIEQEMTIKSIRRQLRLVEVPIHEYARAAGESKINVWRDGPRYVFSCIKYLVMN